jgi:hypothetical protein
MLLRDMRTWPFLLASALLLPSIAEAEEPPPATLASPANNSCTCECLVGFGAPTIGLTRLVGQTGLLFGGRGGAVLRRHFVLGAAGYGLLNKVTMPASAGLGPGGHDVSFGGGGFWFAYIVSPEWIVHPTVGLLLGGGSVSYGVTDQAPGAPATRAQSAFYEASPEIGVDVNVAHFLRIGVGAYYRIATGVKLEDKLKSSDVSGPGATLSLDFGVY